MANTDGLAACSVRPSLRTALISPAAVAYDTAIDRLFFQLERMGALL